MANLKDIGYGIGKYLTVSDASDIPGIGNNRKNLDLLNFKVATNNAYTLYNFKDGMIDAYQTEGGVDTGTSTNEAYDSTSKFYTPYTNPGGYIDANTLLMLHMDGTNAGTTFTDSSASPYTITPTAVTTNTSIKKLGTASAEYNLTGWLEPQSSSAFKLGDTNASWTIEFWINLDTIPTHYIVMDHRANTQNNGGFSFFTNVGTGGVGFDSSNGTTWAGNLQDPVANTVDIWYHYAIVQVGGSTIKMYRNGTEVDSSTTLMSDASGTYINWFIGKGYNNGGSHSNNYGIDGFLDEVRVSNVARWTSNFTPPTKPYTTGSATENMTIVSNTQTAQAAPTTGRLMIYEEDVDAITLDTDLKGYVSRDGGTTYTQTPLVLDGNITHPTSLLLHCDGANDGVVFTDSSFFTHPITVVGSTHTDTAVKKFGTASAQFDGTGDSLTIPDSGAWDFNTDPFAIDLWVNCNSTQTSGTYKGIVSSGGSVWVGGEWTLTMNTSNGFLEWWRDAGAGGILMITSTTNFKDDAWHHVAVTKQGDNTKMFVDGTQQGSTYSTGYSLVAPSTGLEIGDNGFGVDRSLVGYIDELRITKGLSRWTANFTPPTAPYTGAEGDTRLLSGSVDISGQPSGTNMKYKVETLNQKNLKLHGASLLWA